MEASKANDGQVNVGTLCEETGKGPQHVTNMIGMVRDMLILKAENLLTESEDETNADKANELTAQADRVQTFAEKMEAVGGPSGSKKQTPEQLQDLAVSLL